MAASSTSRLSSFLQRGRQWATRTAVGGVVTLAVVEYTTELPSQGRASWFYHYLSDEYGTPLLRATLGPETAHNVALQLLQWGLAPHHRPNAAEQQISWHQSHLFANADQSVPGLLPQVQNPIGLAAGFDKHGQALRPLLQLGFGFVEVGTVTPEPQPGNPQPRMFRLLPDRAVINRYGFNSHGAAAVQQNLERYRREEEEEKTQQLSSSSSASTLPWWQQLWCTLYPPHPARGPIGVNIGKNKRTPNEQAVQDYVSNIQRLAPYADYLVVNISSPNTPNLRELQRGDEFEALLEACCRARNQTADALGQPRIPLLVKLAPDLSDDELQQIATTCLQSPRRCDGIVVTNTTHQRPADLLTHATISEETGGLSGAPLKQLSTQLIRKLFRYTQGQIPILGVGGIANGRDAYQKLTAGASAVQIYTCLVYEGPGVVSRMRQELAQLMKQNGHRDLQLDVVGRDHDDLFWQRREKLMEARLKTKAAAEPVLLDNEE